MAMDKRFLGTTATRRRMLGVNLIELMIVVMVIGVLGMIALPSYRQYTMRAHRAEAKNALLQLQTNQERFYLLNRRYGTIAELQAANLLANPARSERGTYTIDMPVAPDAAGFTARATPRAGNTPDQTADVDCASFSLTAQGVRTHTGNPATACW
jgi:type IV pilus assembly protein PilE